MNLSKVSHLPLAACLAALIMVGMPALARLNPKPTEDSWLRLRPPLYPVAGTLVYEGRPVAGAVVTFVARNNGAERQHLAVSPTDKEGRFWLRTFSAHGDGAVAGRHRIKVEHLVPTGRMLPGPGMDAVLQITPPTVAPGDEAVADREPDAAPPAADSSTGVSLFPGMPEMVNILPPRFANETTSGLTADVTEEGPNEFLIRLHAEPPPAVEN